MGRITTNVGLITGIPITDTVNQLLQVSARSRDLIAARNQRLKTEGDAVAQLTALSLAVQFAARRLKNENLFTAKTANSSNSAALTATVSGKPAIGTYQFTPIRLAQTEHSLSSGFASPTASLSPGTLSIRFGGFVDEGISLSELNGGQGAPKGKIRITDRSGASAEIDLRFAQTVDDVLDAINKNGQIAVTARTEGDRFVLADHTGATANNLRVQEVSTGTTAAALGLAGINAAADSAMGQDVLRLFENLSLGRLNNGNGVSISPNAPDLLVTFRDNSGTLAIDFHNPLPAPGKTEKTLGELLATINAADPSRLRAEISPDGDSLRLIDLTADSGGAFSVNSASGGRVAEDLGLTTSAVNGEITSRRLQAGLKTSLLSSLNGGAGLGELGLVHLTDRGGSNATIDLSAAQTLDDVLAAINGAGLGISARVNDARNGLALVDTTGESAGNLVIANGDATNSADKLGIAIDAAVSQKDSGSRHLQVVAAQRALASLKGGKGIAAGSVRIVNSAGQAAVFTVSNAAEKTIGDVIRSINELAINVEARLNSTGDGLLLVDKAGGGGTLTVQEVGSGQTAKDLRLLQASKTVSIDDTPRQVIDGSTTASIEIVEGDTLTDLIRKINESDAGATASLFNDGSSTAPFRISLLSKVSGRSGALQIDGSQAGIASENLAPAQDALLSFGAGAGFLVSSGSGVFENVVEGLRLSVLNTSSDPVSVSVAESTDALAAAMNTFVEQYNKLRDKLKELTRFDPEGQTTGPLFGSLEALRLDTQLGELLSGRFRGVGSVQSLGEIGLSLDENGRLNFDAQRLRAAAAERPADIESLFTNETLGLASRLDAQLELLVGPNNSLLLSRSAALQRKIELNDERIERHNARLERERERLIKQFTLLELAIAKIRENQNAIDRIQPIFLDNRN